MDDRLLTDSSSNVTDHPKKYYGREFMKKVLALADLL